MKQVVSTARSIWKRVARTAIKFAQGVIAALATEIAVVGLKQAFRGAVGVACLFA